MGLSAPGTVLLKKPCSCGTPSTSSRAHHFTDLFRLPPAPYPIYEDCNFPWSSWSLSKNLSIWGLCAPTYPNKVPVTGQRRWTQAGVGTAVHLTIHPEVPRPHLQIQTSRAHVSFLSIDSARSDEFSMYMNIPGKQGS